MTGLHPTDERAVTALRVLRHPDLSASEQLDVLLPLLEIPGVQKVLRSNLKPVFEDAREDGIDLSRPPADMHVWLQKPLGRIGDELGAAKPNTYNARATALSRMYERLRALGAVTANPVDGLPRHARERATDPLPSRVELQRLHVHATDPHVRAALHLIDDLAFTMTDLLTLRWAQVDLSRERLLRRTECRLPQASLQALHALARLDAAPLNPDAADQRVFPFDDQQLRARLWQAFQTADVAWVPPSQLRMAALRDHGLVVTAAPHLAAHQFGFTDVRAYQQAVDLARALSVRDPEDTAVPSAQP
ncbi:hypothetical protein [Deinococcus enclensis]|uniref:Uncharacterized protein n=1 Tax=Deinococcus enclensis TaxID=1049582 RepID=A0ABT9MEZ0_9DEIO|nr:hypothetical protein [Deinococcus enclensis]MDP9765115.1 hypothetical protein [Deinococcus enclensis]